LIKRFEPLERFERFELTLGSQFPYKNSGSHNVIPGQMYMQARHRQTMSIYGIMPAKI